jgi:hypothetical protein
MSTPSDHDSAGVNDDEAAAEQARAVVPHQH